MRKARIIILIVMLSLVGVAIGLGAGLGAYFAKASKNEEVRAENTPKEMPTIMLDGEEYIVNDTVNYLVVGVDSTGELKSSNGYNNTALNDFMCLVSFDLTNKTYVLIPINRVTMVDIDIIGLAGKPISTRFAQIAYAHTIGDGMEMSFINTKRAVSKVLLGLDIERYIGINMSTVQLINDAIGGVEITLEEDLTAVHSDWVEGATITLTGDNCLDYIRARMSVSDGTQLSRMRRQQVYIEAVVQKARTTEYQYSDVKKMILNINKYLCMDVTLMDVTDLMVYVKTFEYKGIKRIEGTTQVRNNLIEFTPDPDKLKELLKDCFYTKKETPTEDETDA